MMLSHKETRYLPYTPEQMKALVLDVGTYPEFLPWCVGAQVSTISDAHLVAKLDVGFKRLRESYVSDIYINGGEIQVSSRTGLFNRLNNRWLFEDSGEGCNLSFELEFEFRSRSLQLLMGGVFHNALRLMVNAFEHRAETLYGK